MAKTFEQAKTPFQNMSWTPDVPSSALGPQEYNSGRNVETDTRGIRSVQGDEEILDSITGTPIFITGGYRAGNQWWYIAATAEGYWYASIAGGAWFNITPGGGPLAGYSESMNITDAWNGTIPFLNDGINPPMFMLAYEQELRMYSNTPPLEITNAVGDGTDVTYTFTTWEGAGLPFAVGEYITIEGCLSADYNGSYFVDAVTSSTVTVTNSTTATFTTGGTISPEYIWNYNPDWIGLSAGFVRMYNTPNVGSILVAGNLTGYYVLDDSSIDYSEFPVTVRWSQQFGLERIPASWQPTQQNVANELEVPVRGPVLDGFASNGNFYIQSYWDTVVFSPINYQTTTVPILGVRIANIGRGLLTTNAWSTADNIVVGIDSRDIWVFNGQDFKGLGNQRVKNFVLGNINPLYQDRVFVQNNTLKNQIEIYYPDFDSTGWCNKMISYRYDLDVFNAPRDVPNAAMATEGPLYTLFEDSTEGYDNSYRTVTYCRAVADTKIVQKDQGFTFINGPIVTEFRRDNILLSPKYSQQMMVHRILPEVYNLDNDSLVTLSTGNVEITVGGSNSVGEVVDYKNTVTYNINTNDPWIQVNQNVFRTNSIKIGHTSSTDAWICSSINWQYSVTQDAR